MRHRIAFVVLMATIGGVPSADAHPPYERTARVLETPSGEIAVVKSYVDGIIGTDPAKIVVRSNGAVLAETDYYRDTSLACGMRRCLIAAADSPFALIPERIWVLEGSSLRTLDSMAARVIGTAVHLWNHLFGYGVAVLFVLLPITAIRQVARGLESEGSKAGCLSAFLAVGAVGILIVWFYVVVVLSELWLLWALLLGVALILAERVVREWRANNALQLTRPAQATEPRS